MGLEDDENFLFGGKHGPILRSKLAVRFEELFFVRPLLWLKRQIYVEVHFCTKVIPKVYTSRWVFLPPLSSKSTEFSILRFCFGFVLGFDTFPKTPKKKHLKKQEVKVSMYIGPV